MNLIPYIKGFGRFVGHHSPAILSIAGAASVTAGTIIIVKKAKNSSDLNDICEKRITVARETEDGKAIFKAHLRNTLTKTKYYAVPICLISAGVFSMLTGTVIQSKRLKLTSAALTALSSEYASYRNRVREFLGEEKENDLYHGITRDENGEPVRDENGRIVTNPVCPTVSLYLDESSSLYTNDGAELWRRLSAAQTTLNTMLIERARFDPQGIGRVSGNEVIEKLGYSTSFNTREGSVRGYIYKRDDPEYGKTCIDFHLDDKLKESWKPDVFLDIELPHSIYDTLKTGRRLTSEEKRAVIRHEVAMEDLQ